MKSLLTLFNRRDLLIYLVITRLKSGHQNHILGYFWWLLDPILLMLIYWFMIDIVLQRGRPNYALFILCGLIPYRALTMSLMHCISSISSKFSVINQINFPKSFLPISEIIVNHVRLIPALLVVIIAALMLGEPINSNVFLVVIPLFFQFLLVIGMGLVLSILGVYLPDIKNLMHFFMRIWIYLSPILYSLDQVPGHLQGLLYLNPITPILIMYNKILLTSEFPSWIDILMATFHSIIFLIIGVFVFNKYQNKIIKMI